MSAVPKYARLHRAGGDDRRDPRLSGGGTLVRASWLENGDLKFAIVRLLNISKRGIALEIQGNPQRNTNIRIQSDKLKLAGTATIRHIWKSGSRSVIGAEFRDGLEFREPKSDERLESFEF